MTRFPSVPLGGARRRLWSAATVVTAGTLVTMAFSAAPASAHTTAYRQINLVSDQPGKASLTDPDLVNAWGLAASPGTNAAPGSPLWVADNGSDKATLYAGATATSVSKVGLVVSVSGAAPTGQVFNSDASAFVVRDNQGHSGSALFLFDTENGTIDGWNPAVGANGSNPSTVTEVAHDRRAKAVPVRAGRGLQRQLPAGQAARWAVRGSAASCRLRAVRHRRDQRQAVCDVRQARRHAAR